MTLSLVPRRPGIAVVAGALTLAALTACGAPSDAPKADFCTAATAGNSPAIYQAIEAEDWTKVETIYHDQADDLDDVGTPKGISDEARDGFNVKIEALKDTSAETIEKSVADGADVVRNDVKGEDLKKLEAFEKYVITTCANAK